jgi:hypothetical protein
MAPRLTIAMSFRVVRGRPESSNGEPRCGSPLGASGRPQPARAHPRLAPRRRRQVAPSIQRPWHHGEHRGASRSTRAQSTNGVSRRSGHRRHLGATPPPPRRTRRVAPARTAPSDGGPSTVSSTRARCSLHTRRQKRAAPDNRSSWRCAQVTRLSAVSRGHRSQCLAAEVSAFRRTPYAKGGVSAVCRGGLRRH